MEEDIVVSKKFVSKLFKERKENYKRFIISTWINVMLVIALFLVITLNILTSAEKEKVNLEKTSSEIAILNSKIDNLNSELSQKNEEIYNLNERVTFLSFFQAMYSSEEALGAQVEAEEEIVANEWWKNINLFTIGQQVPLPDIDTNTFRCMDYRTITDSSSWQYKFQKENLTDYYNGLRYYVYNGEKYYSVALATAYGIDLGNAYKVELQNGVTFNIVHAEYKHDITKPSPTDYGDKDVNYDGEETCSVIEFVYDWINAPQGLISDGEANRWLGEGCDIYGDSCNIKSMTFLGKIWTTN